MSGPSYVSARVDGERGVAAALKALRGVGVPRERVEVLSDLPLPARVLGGEMRRCRLPLFTAAGLVGGLVVGVFFSVGTLFLYPLLVGGQVSRIAPPNLIIIYELTMFGIVVATAAGFFVETRGRGPRRPYFEGVSTGETFVVVELPPDLIASRVLRALEASGAEPIEEAAS
ncbi:MAG: quinol:electron acceptor oxidoreductase subunit ActD [Thermoleophilia bacterium]